MIYGLFAPTQAPDTTAAFQVVRDFLASNTVREDEEKAFVSRGIVNFDALVAREAKKFYPETHLQLIVPHGPYPGDSPFDASLKRLGEKLVAPDFGNFPDNRREANRIALSIVDQAVFFMETKQFAKSELAHLLTQAKELSATHGITVETLLLPSSAPDERTS